MEVWDSPSSSLRCGRNLERTKRMVLRCHPPGLRMGLHTFANVRSSKLILRLKVPRSSIPTSLLRPAK